MSAVVLSDAFFAKIAGWEAMKQARDYLARDQVLSSNWTPPVLKGVVQGGPTAYRAGLVIKDAVDIENLCTCRDAREWGKICAHSVAVGLHHLRGVQAPSLVVPPSGGRAVTGSTAHDTSSAAPAKAGTANVASLLRDADGEPAELFVILPPNLEPAIARGKVMLCFEGKWRGGRAPLNALPNSQAFAFSTQDTAVLDQVETLAGGAPAMVQLEVKNFAALLPVLTDHPRVTLGKSATVTITRSPWTPLLQATLEANGEIPVTFGIERGENNREEEGQTKISLKILPPTMVGRSARPLCW